MDISLRSLRYFLAVAEESHISRAARRLHIAQPALSKTIARLEREIGLELFVRTSTGVELTEPGRSFVVAAREALDTVDTWHAAACAAEDTRRRTLSIGYHSSIPDDLLRAITERFGAALPDWQLEWRLGDWSDPTRPVREGRVAAALLQLPVDATDDLHVRVLRRDRRVVALPAGHRLEAHDTVALSNLEDEPFVALPTTTGPLREFCLATEHRERRARIGREVDNAEDFFQAVITGQGRRLDDRVQQPRLPQARPRLPTRDRCPGQRPRLAVAPLGPPTSTVGGVPPRLLARGPLGLPSVGRVTAAGRARPGDDAGPPAAGPDLGRGQCVPARPGPSARPRRRPVASSTRSRKPPPVALGDGRVRPQRLGPVPYPRARRFHRCGATPATDNGSPGSPTPCCGSTGTDSSRPRSTSSHELWPSSTGEEALR